MKKKWMASTALACSCMLLISGCSGNKADDFDAVAYTTAYLDGMIRGNVDTLSSLSGVSSDDLTATFNSMIDDLVSSSIGGDGSSPEVHRFLHSCVRTILISGNRLSVTQNTM